jgi:RNA polymerase sigma-70 factor (ECF subfamily)
MPSRFQETRWTLVLAAAGDSTRGRQALGELCEQYWSPLFAFARARGLTPEDAQDATQGFFEQLIARGDLAAADPERGRFRAFLLVAFKHFMANERDRARALKRGGAQIFVPLDAVDRPIEPAHHETPESLYEREWARTLLGRAVSRLMEEAGPDGAPLVAHLGAVMTGDGADVPMKSLAATLQVSEGAARVALHRMRAKLRRAILEEIGQTVGPGEDVEDELQHVLASLG